MDLGWQEHLVQTSCRCSHTQWLLHRQDGYDFLGNKADNSTGDPVSHSDGAPKLEHADDSRTK